MNDSHFTPLRILAVDDEATIIKLYQKILTPRRGAAEAPLESEELARTFLGETSPPASSLSFDVVTCRQGDEAIEVVKAAIEENRPFAVAFVDVRMPPGPDGIWVAKQIRKIDPHIEIVIVTAHSDIRPTEIARQVLPSHKILYLQKPFHPHEITQFASALSAKWLAEHELRKIHGKLERRIEERTSDLLEANEQLTEEIEERRKIEGHLRQLEKAVTTMQLGVIITDLDGNITYINRAGAEMHGYQTNELLGQDVDILTPPKFQKPPTIPQLKDWKGLVREGMHIRKNGMSFPVWLMSEIVQDADRVSVAVVTSCEDITERKQAEEALRKSEEQHRIVLESVPDPVMVYDGDENVTYLNPAFMRVFGWSLGDYPECTMQFVPIEESAEVKVIAEKIARGETVSGLETYRFTEDKRRIDVSISGAGFFDRQSKLQGSVISLQDITARKKNEEEIKFLAYNDALTGLQNRKSFYMHLEDEIIRAHGRKGQKRRGLGDKWALMFLDLDRFKTINDLLGHDMGDLLLCAVSDRIKTHLRKSDYVFRLGGDEFTIIIHNFSESSDLAKVAQKIREIVARPFSIKNRDLFITVSIGISVFPDDGDDVEALVKNADIAVYAAKEAGLGYRFFTEEMNRKALERMTLESQLRLALQNNQFLVYYQPVVNWKEQIIGAEALIRWHHPELGMVSPTSFIPIAEETGAIIPIGKWILHAACQQAAFWHNMGFSDFELAVNLSTRQLKDPGLLATIEKVLEESGLGPERLKLEVTESGIIEHPEHAIAKMTRLRSTGVRFALDDFGTGYSSLIYLKRFPLDVLKIDQSFVRDCTTNTDDQEIIKAIVGMARNLGMRTVAEGVETLEQKEFLIRQGCHLMQGYYFGHPMPAEQFEAMLRPIKIAS